MKRRLALLALAALLAASPSLAAAQSRGDSLGAGWRQQQDEAREGVRRGRMAPMSMVIAQISRRYPGRPLDAGIEEWGGRAVYRVRWATDDGRRMDFIVDAESGSIISGG